MPTKQMLTTPPPHATAALVLADGKVFYGFGIGAKGTSVGEICFNTGMTGYQETLTDPSYAGQIITFTFPHIGNVGTNLQDVEGQTPVVKGLVIRDPITPPSNFRSTASLQEWLSKNKIIGINGVDTRALTRYIRKAGPQNAAICHVSDASKLDITKLQQKAIAHPSLNGLELAQTVTRKTNDSWQESIWTLTPKQVISTPVTGLHVVAIDYGAKLNILRHLIHAGCRVTVVPATTPMDDILALQPDGVFLSNGPGDPAATGHYATSVLQGLIDKNIPIFGICLGHQLLALALGCQTFKMLQGHRGSNHPVLRSQTGRVEITSQNHGFTVDINTIPHDVEVTHVSLFDGTVEGLKHKTKPVFSVQYHPESSPGPHDSQYLFEHFVALMKTYQS